VQGIFERAACVPGDDMQITVVLKGRVHPVSHCACFQWGAGPPSPPTLLLRQLASCLAQLVRTVACGVWLQLHACLCSSSLTNMCRRGRALLWRRSLVGKEIAGWLGALCWTNDANNLNESVASLCRLAGTVLTMPLARRWLAGGDAGQHRDAGAASGLSSDQRQRVRRVL
jgi:hypothetical protein